MIVKVCGMREPDNIRAVEQTGPDWMGFIFFPHSSRHVSLRPAYLPERCKRVGVFVNEVTPAILQKAEEFDLHYIQLHGTETSEQCLNLKRAGLGVIKVFPIASMSDLKSTVCYENVCDYFLFDTACTGYGGSGKTFMVREGLFDDVDAALTWHPEAWAGMFSTRTLANIQAAWRFTGTAAHAANSPHLGRSALDALTLMTTGSNFLNEHIIEKARVHYAITDTGGVSPNVVQAQAEVLYLIRAPEMADAEQIFARIEKIAQGAALMTETQVSCRFEKACSSYLPNRTLEAAMYQAVCHYGTPAWSDEERAFAAAIRATLSANDINNSLNNIAGTSGEEGKTFARRHRDTLLIDEVAPWAATDNVLAGSTDVGDVSWKAPVAQCFSPCFAVGTPLHSWQLVSQGRTSIAHKGMLLAGKVLAATAIRLFSDSALLEASQQELRQVLAERPYRCPIPAEVSPSVLR